MALPPPFPSTTPVVPLLPSPTLSAELDALRKDARFGRMSVAVVDMSLRIRLLGATIGLNFSGGWNTNQTRYSASLVKIAAMFAAFRLRKNLRDAAAVVTAKDPADMLKQVTADWKPIVETARGKGPKDFPQLGKIFTVGGATGGWTIDFDPVFETNMKKMIGPSSNEASSYCILALGYQYINGALRADGLYVDGPGGLWLAGDYSSGRDWIPEPTSKSFQAASPAAVVRFMTLLETGQLVSPADSGEMQNMMTNHYMKRILRDDGRAVSRHYGKLGIGVDGTYHDTALIERSVDGQTIRYVVVMLGSKGDVPLWDLGLMIDNVILSTNGLPVPP